MKPSFTKKGYSYIRLCKESKYTASFVHRMVAMAFVPNPQGLPEVNHINGVKVDNRPENLEWCTRQQNVDHAKASGFVHRGEQIVQSKLTEERVTAIRMRLARGAYQGKLAKEFGVSEALVSLIKTRQVWKHVA